jgi:GWxTD domain-containing protein
MQKKQEYPGFMFKSSRFRSTSNSSCKGASSAAIFALALAACAVPGWTQQPTASGTAAPPSTQAGSAQSGTPQASGSQTTSNPQLTQRPTGDVPAQDANQDPLNRKLSDKEQFKQQKEVREELKGPYKKWVNEDVHWIITDQELKAFKSLSNDEERDNFIEQFWLRRNPNPDSPENEFREEHYRRIAYSNEHFAAGKPGWKTDRGHMYISFGKPDSIDSHPSGGEYQRPMDEGGGETSTFPFEVWHYRYLEGVGDNIDIEFVDSCMCGDYHMTINRAEKDALLHTPGAGLTQAESMGMAKKADRFNGGMEQLGSGPMTSTNAAKQFDRIELMAKLNAPPVIKYKDLDLEAYMSQHKLLNGPYFPFDVRTDFVKVTDDTVLVPVTLQIKNRDITFQAKDGVSKGVVNIQGRVTTITGRIVQSFEDTVEVEEPSELMDKVLDNSKVYWKAMPLRPGRYRIDIGIKDVNNPDHVGIWGQGIVVPKFDEDRLSASSLILADKMERVPSKQIGTGNFIIGNTYIRPRVMQTAATPASFKRDQKLNFWMQVYNLGIDEKSRQNAATIQYEIIDSTTSKSVVTTSEDSKALGANQDQVTLEKSMPLTSLQPGKYMVKISVNDSVSKQTIAQTVPFTVE